MQQIKLKCVLPVSDVSHPGGVHEGVGRLVGVPFQRREGADGHRQRGPSQGLAQQPRQKGVLVGDTRDVPTRVAQSRDHVVERQKSQV